MCAVSQISDYGQRRFPQTDWWPNQIPQGTTDPHILEELRQQREMLEKFMKLVEAAKVFDAVAKEPDCEDPAKADFIKQVEDRLQRIEKAIGL